MLYGSGDYDVARNYTSSPVPRVRPEASGIADKHRGVDPETVKMDEGPMRHAGVRSPILVDPVYNSGKYSNRSARPAPRVRPEAEEVAEKAKGSMSLLFSNYGKPDPYDYQNSRDENINPKKGPLRQAGIRSPILVDPVYTRGEYTGRTARPAPRVKPEAEEIATRSKGTVAKLFVTEERRYNEIDRPKKQPKDHGNENVKRMRRIQREAKAREARKNTPVKAMWKSTHYDSVESRVKDFMQDPPRAPRVVNDAQRPSSAPARSTRIVGEESNKYQQPKPQQSMTPREVRKNTPVNFVARNARASKSYELRRSKSQLAVDDSRTKYSDDLSNYNLNVRGKTPSYLQSRQKRWNREEQTRIRNMPDPTVPEGHTVLPDQERRQTLATLKSTAVSYTVLEETKDTYSRNMQYFAETHQKLDISPRNHYQYQAYRPQYVSNEHDVSEDGNSCASRASFADEEYGYSPHVQYLPHPPTAPLRYDSSPQHDRYTGADLSGHYYTPVDHQVTDRSPKADYHRPNINIRAKNGSSVYIYAPHNTSNHVTSSESDASLPETRLYEEPNQITPYHRDDFVAKDEYDQFVDEQLPYSHKKAVSFRTPDAIEREKFIRSYNPESYLTDRIPVANRTSTAYRDAFERNPEVDYQAEMLGVDLDSVQRAQSLTIVL